jgi:nicotinamidase-related amidase
MVQTLALPAHYKPENVVDDTRWIDYGALQTAAFDTRRSLNLKPSKDDDRKVGLLLIDTQRTFCDPQGELFVGGMSGDGAVQDSIRTTEFIYRNLATISSIDCTLDTHRAYAVFHSSFLVNDNGDHPDPFSTITNADILSGVWRADPFAAAAIDVPLMWLQNHIKDYTAQLEAAGRYALTMWPYHGMLGDKGHALVSGIAEAVNYHGLVRGVQPGFEVKGTWAMVENYSVLAPEVTNLWDGKTKIPRNTEFFKKLIENDVLVITGQAASHCVAWTIEDLLTQIAAVDIALAKKVYVMRDCTTPIVVKDPGTGAVIYDYGPDTDKAFDKFLNAGMHVVNSTDPIESWADAQLG